MKKPFFFCAVGGSGMMPLALMLRARGCVVRGSDRAFDQGRTPERFAFLRAQGIDLFPQDGSGVTQDIGQLVVSSAVEETVPDYQAALRFGIPVRKRAEILAEIFNEARQSIAVAGTSGKSTTTGMIGWILSACDKNPSIVNGAAMKNFMNDDAPFSSMRAGDPELFVAEVDESDGSIALFAPSIAVIGNITLDHKPLDELRALFTSFAGKAKKRIVNLDDPEAAALAVQDSVTFSLRSDAAMLFAHAVVHHPCGVSFDVVARPSGEHVRIDLQVPGAHNIENALAALGAAMAADVPFTQAANALHSFAGIARRMDVLGCARGVTVIDDFAHNPGKIAAALQSLRLFEGRILILFQPHGYGPLRLMRAELAECFKNALSAEDRVFIPDPLYLGGTVDRSVSSADLAKDIGAQARAISDREICAKEIVAHARAGDRIVVMGARDDTLPELGKRILATLSKTT